MDDDAIRKLLWSAGRGSWLRCESMDDPVLNEARITALLLKAGGIEAFRPAGSDSKPN